MCIYIYILLFPLISYPMNPTTGFRVQVPPTGPSAGPFRLREPFSWSEVGGFGLAVAIGLVGCRQPSVWSQKAVRSRLW